MIGIRLQQVRPAFYPNFSLLAVFFWNYRTPGHSVCSDEAYNFTLLYPMSSTWLPPRPLPSSASSVVVSYAPGPVNMGELLI